MYMYIVGYAVGNLVLRRRASGSHSLLSVKFLLNISKENHKSIFFLCDWPLGVNKHAISLQMKVYSRVAVSHVRHLWKSILQPKKSRRYHVYDCDCWKFCICLSRLISACIFMLENEVDGMTSTNKFILRSIVELFANCIGSNFNIHICLHLMHYSLSVTLDCYSEGVAT